MTSTNTRSLSLTLDTLGVKRVKQTRGQLTAEVPTSVGHADRDPPALRLTRSVRVGAYPERTVRFFFADDSKQTSPSRAGMGPLVAIGGVMVSHREVDALRDDIDGLCDNAGFPAGEPFKWSPGPDLWMHDNLKDANRERFFRRVLKAANDHQTGALVVMEDTNKRTATGARSAELDVTTMFLERADIEFGRAGTKGVVVVDRPGGSRKHEEKFLGDCVDMLQAGTDFWQKAHTLFVVSAPSKLLRLLQLADLVTSCTCAYVSGESSWAPTTFKSIRPMFREWQGSVGGTGLKLHPDFLYANLYHWLLGDSQFRRGNAAAPMPLRGRPYADGPDVPR
jgi:hypothetical protein